MTNLEIKLLSDNSTMPTRNNLDAGYDIYAAETKIIEPQEKALIATDLAVNIPQGYVGLLTSRSGVSSKTHLVIETGKIDAGYQGHMKINIKNDIEKSLKVKPKAFTTNYMYDLKNISEEEIGLFFQPSCYQINKGDKLAQLVIVPIFTSELQEVTDFSNETARGQQGFGSTGY